MPNKSSGWPECESCGGHSGFPASRAQVCRGFRSTDRWVSFAGRLDPTNAARPSRNRRSPGALFHCGATHLAKGARHENCVRCHCRVRQLPLGSCNASHSSSHRVHISTHGYAAARPASALGLQLARRLRLAGRQPADLLLRARELAALRLSVADRPSRSLSGAAVLVGSRRVDTAKSPTHGRAS